MSKKKKTDYSSTGGGGSRKIGDLLKVPHTDVEPAGKKDIQGSQEKQFSPAAHRAEIWISKKGRAGKQVSLIKHLHISEKQKTAVLKQLKASLACGGTFKDGEMIIQSIDREKIKTILEKHGVPAKICGG